MSVNSPTEQPPLAVTADRLFAVVRAVLSQPTAATATPPETAPAEASALTPHLREAARAAFSFTPIRQPWVPPDPVRPDWLVQELARRHPELWELVGGGPLGPVAISPQPLPPRTRFAQALAESIIERATLARPPRPRSPNCRARSGPPACAWRKRPSAAARRSHCAGRRGHPSSPGSIWTPSALSAIDTMR